MTKSELGTLNDQKEILNNSQDLMLASRYLFDEDKLDLKARDVEYEAVQDKKDREEQQWLDMLELAQTATANTSATRIESKGPLVLTLTELKQIKAR